MKKTLVLAAMLAASCGSSEEKVCDPGDQKTCACVGGGEGAQVCREDGSGWEECDCPCEPDCTDKECGDDGCGGSCGSCDVGSCNADGICQECAGNQECIDLYGANYYCDLTVLKCRESCVVDCAGRECGDDGCGGSCGTCTPPETCNNGVCGADDCCPGEGEYAVDITGSVIMLLTLGPSGEMAVSMVDAMTALTSSHPTPLTTTYSDSLGHYQTDCFDLGNVPLGVFALTDDETHDGTAGAYYPTYTLVMGISSGADKVCLPSETTPTPEAFAMAVTEIPRLSTAPAMNDIYIDGFAIVMITDAEDNPVAGAALKKEDGTDLDRTVVYPNDVFTDYSSAVTTANGIAMVAGPMALTHVKPEAAGHTWPSMTMAIVEGFCMVFTAAAYP